MSTKFLSITEIIPWSHIKLEDFIVAFRFFFDGSKNGKWLTLSAITSTEIQWKNLEVQWLATLEKHGAPRWKGSPFLHTTDAVARENAYKGWSKKKAEDLLTECASVVKRCMPLRNSERMDGILPVSVTIDLDVFTRALKTVPELGSPQYMCALSCFEACCHLGAKYHRAKRFCCVFDQGENFYGHMQHRRQNRIARREEKIWKKMDFMGEGDMRVTPSLQATDLVAWCVNSHARYGYTHLWQVDLLRTPLMRFNLTYDRLVNPNWDAIAWIESLRLPRRRPFITTNL